MYECVGAGKDLCDVGGSAAVDNTGNALVRTTTGTVVFVGTVRSVGTVEIFVCSDILICLL